MVTLLLPVIYLAFISLGLPDSMLGSAWPVMHLELGAPISAAGIISMLISGCTIVSALLSDRLTRRLGAGLVTAVSVCLTALALFGFSVSHSLAALCLWAIPYGLGAGSVDAALNNYVALHYSARHMSWLHCFWGVGASISPYIMAAALAQNGNWRGGYRTVSIAQAVLTVLLFCSLPLWLKRSAAKAENGQAPRPVGVSGALRIPGVPQVLLAFLCYCAAESTCFLWASSYLVEARGVDAVTAARFASLFFLGITAGRFLNGLVADRLGDKRLIRIGIGGMLLGVALIALPAAEALPALIGLVVLGFGCAPVYPSIIHGTPRHFGGENSQAIIGIQMASAYVGSTLMPPLFGLIARHISMALFPWYVLLFTALLLLLTERLNRLMREKA